MTTKKISHDTTQPEQPRLRYLTIRNWSKFQQQSKSGKTMPWCKLYSAQADDFEYQRLTSFQRGVLHDCYLVVTRTAHTLHNDITWLSRTLHTLGTDRPHLHHAIATLISRRFLIPTESTNPFCESENKRESEKENESEIETESARTRRIPFSSDPPTGATDKLVDDGRHVGWVINGEDCYFGEAA